MSDGTGSPRPGRPTTSGDPTRRDVATVGGAANCGDEVTRRGQATGREAATRRGAVSPAGAVSRADAASPADAVNCVGAVSPADAATCGGQKVRREGAILGLPAVDRQAFRWLTACRAMAVCAHASGWVLTSCLLLALTIGCAKMRAPGGGPIDETDPYLVSSYPDSAATEVGAIDSLVLVFSEPMKRRTVEESFRITPAVEFRSIEWEADTLTFRLMAPLDTASTYVGLLGGEASDRRNRKLGQPWVWPFSTGHEIDPGGVSGKVFGSRIRASGLYVYVWPWEAGPPDTTESYFPPDPLRLGQTGSDGTFTVDYLPRDRPLRLCAFYDRDGDGSYQPLPDRWACAEDPIVLVDTVSVISDVSIYLTERDEPGVLSGTVVDSLCLALDPKELLQAVRAERDSLLEWLSGEYDARQRGRGTLTVADSLRIEGEMSRIAAQEESGVADSLLCVQSIRVELRAGADSLVAATSGPDFRFADVDPGIYRLSAFRDVDGDTERSVGEAVGQFPYALEVLPLRTLDELEVEIAVPPGESLLRPVPAPPDSLPTSSVPQVSP